MGYYDKMRAFWDQFDILCEVNEPDLSWEFSTVRVIREKESGRYFYVGDAGCSCPTLFEYTEYSDLSPLNQYTMHDFAEYMKNFGISLDDRNAVIRTLELLGVDNRRN